jgi:hypothetical protein
MRILSLTLSLAAGRTRGGASAQKRSPIGKFGGVVGREGAVAANVAVADAAQRDRARDRAGQPVRAGHRDSCRRYKSGAPEDPETGSQDLEAGGG